MAVSTASTKLYYGTKQVNTATVVGTISTAGNATITVTGAGITGSPVAVTVAVALADNATAVAGKVVTALNANTAINALYVATQSGTSIVLTRLQAAANDATLNIGIANGTCVGLTIAATSVKTTAGVDFAKLVDVSSYPDMGSTPSKLDATNLTSDTIKTSILGLQELPDLTFDCMYDLTAYNAISLLTSTYNFKLEFGASGVNGNFVWDGHVKIYAAGGGVDEVRKMQVTVSAESQIILV